MIGRTAADRELTRQGQASERFTRAIDQLGSDRTETRIGGIYGLEQIARQTPDNRLAVTDVLVAYLHRRAPRPPGQQPAYSAEQPLPALAPDVQAALTVLSRRHVEPDDPRLDLSELDLAGADLAGMNLANTDLSGALLDFASLDDADLHGAFLDFAILTDAWLRGADLTDALLTGADLTGADLSGADLTNADLGSIIFEDGGTTYGAILDCADLRGAILDGTRLDGASADPFARWPDGFDWRAAGVSEEEVDSEEDDSEEEDDDFFRCLALRP